MVDLLLLSRVNASVFKVVPHQSLHLSSLA